MAALELEESHPAAQPRAPLHQHLRLEPVVLVRVRLADAGGASTPNCQRTWFFPEEARYGYSTYPS